MDRLAKSIVLALTFGATTALSESPPCWVQVNPPSLPDMLFVGDHHYVISYATSGQSSFSATTFSISVTEGLALVAHLPDLGGEPDPGDWTTTLDALEGSGNMFLLKLASASESTSQADMFEISFAVAGMCAVGGANAGEEVQRIAVEVKLSRLEFMDSDEGGELFTIKKDDGTGDYDAPHWEAGEDPQGKPVAFVRGTTPRVEARFQVEPKDLNRELSVYGYGENKGHPMAFPYEEGFPDQDGILEIADWDCQHAFPNVARRLLEWTLNWAYYDAMTDEFRDADSTQHDIYLLLDEPKTDDLYLTIVDVACRNLGQGQNTPEGTLAAIWALFEPLDKIHRAGQPTSVFKFWGDPDEHGKWPNFVDEGFQFTAAAMLAREDNRAPCQSWARFLAKCLWAHGMEGIAVRDIVQDENLIVQIGLAKNPPEEYGPEFHHQALVIKNHQGFQGQGPSTPPLFHNAHSIVEIGGAIYDPSYGKMHSGEGFESPLLEFQRMAMLGIGWSHDEEREDTRTLDATEPLFLKFHGD